jgi:hypothetical protein
MLKRKGIRVRNSDNLCCFHYNQSDFRTIIPARIRSQGRGGPVPRIPAPTGSARTVRRPPGRTRAGGIHLRQAEPEQQGVGGVNRGQRGVDGRPD